MILSGQPYKPLGAPATLGRTDVAAITRDLNPAQVCIHTTFSVGTSQNSH